MEGTKNIKCQKNNNKSPILKRRKCSNLFESLLVRSSLSVFILVCLAFHLCKTRSDIFYSMNAFELILNKVYNYF